MKKFVILMVVSCSLIWASAAFALPVGPILEQKAGTTSLGIQVDVSTREYDGGIFGKGDQDRNLFLGVLSHQLEIGELAICAGAGDPDGADAAFAFGASYTTPNFDLTENVYWVAQGKYLHSGEHNVGGGGFDFDDWHVAAALGYKIDEVNIYVGGRYSDSHSIIDADDNAGVFIGTDFIADESLSVNFEGRFVDEEAGSVALMYHF